MKRLLATIILSCSIVLPATAGETVEAVWQEREVEFTFLSLETAYSCDLMEARIRVLLRHVGADDVEVIIPPCPGFDRPQRRHRGIG